MRNTDIALDRIEKYAIKYVVNGVFVRRVCAVGLALVVSACASRGPVERPPQVLAQAATLSRQAAQDFGRGALVAAEQQYRAAVALYASVARLDEQLQAMLSLARVQAAQDGSSEQALITVRQVLARIEQTPSSEAAIISAETRVLAHGRAAALLMARDVDQAANHWREASAACASPCAHAAALSVLRARLHLQAGEPAAARDLMTTLLPPAVVPEAEQANAWRVRAQALLALQQPAAALADVEQALAIDRRLALSARVVEGLRLQVAAYAALGDAARQAHAQALLNDALQARRDLGPGGAAALL